MQQELLGHEEWEGWGGIVDLWWRGLTQVVCHLVGIPKVLHAEANDVHEVLHQPEELLGIGAHLGAGQGALSRAKCSEGQSSSPEQMWLAQLGHLSLAPYSK